MSAARELFARQGYGATSMQAVAKAADVAVQTVYAIFGTKRAVLIAILDAADAETGTRTLAARLRASTGNPRTQLALLVGFCVRVNTANADLIRRARAALRL